MQQERAEQQRWVAISCTHAPITDKKAWSWLLDLIRDYQPHHVIHLGDWFEGLAASRWPKSPTQKWDAEEEFGMVGKQAIELAEAAPGAKRVWLWGNHDANLLSEPHRIPEDLRRIVIERYERLKRECMQDWKIVEEYSHRARYRLGPITFQHGASAGQSAGKDQAYEYGMPWGLYVCGHTHRPEDVTQARERQFHLPYWYANPGTFIDPARAEYMNRLSMARWGCGAIVGTVTAKSVQHRQPSYSRREWTARLEVFRYHSNVR